MATLGSKLITKEQNWHANMTEQNHLALSLYAKPHKLNSVTKKLFSADHYYSDNPLGSMLSGTKGEETIGNTSWEWTLKGATTRPLVVVENVETGENITPGKYKRTFKIKLDENWYLPGDVIHPGASDKKYQVRIQDDVTPHGDGWIYTVRLNSDDPNAFLPVKYLQPGAQWSKLFSTYEEGAEQSGSAQYSSDLGFKNSMGLIRKQYKVTGLATTEALSVGIPDTKGKIHKTWMSLVEAEHWMQWERECEAYRWYARSTQTVMGANGRPVRQGPGIQEQLEDGHVHKYTHLTAKLIEEFLMDIFYTRVAPGKQRSIKGFTGEYGMIQFHRAIQDWAQKTGFIQTVADNFIQKTDSKYHQNGMVAGYQFMKYRMSNGIELEMVHNPLYDNPEYNREIDPITGYPVESQRITFLDFGGDNSLGSNIKIMNKKDGFAFGYINGLFGPAGPVQGGNSAHSGSYYEMHCEKMEGIHIEDITRCGELRLERAA